MTGNLYEYIGIKIKDLREQHKLSQEDLAIKIKVKPNTISRWETAIYKTKVEDLEKLGKFFSVPISAFLPSEHQPNDIELKALLSATADLSEDDIKTVTDFAIFRKTRSMLSKDKKTK